MLALAIILVAVVVSFGGVGLAGMGDSAGGFARNGFMVFVVLALLVLLS